MQSSAKTVDAYLAELPPDRAELMAEVRAMVLEALPEGYEESMAFGMITWSVPLAVYPDTYNKQPLVYAALASQKNYVSLYLMCAYIGAGIGEDDIRARWSGGKPLNMGKSCVRFKALSDLDLPLLREVIGQHSVGDFVEVARAAHRR
jgi:hypothetical protein